ncbi:protocadherin-8 [Protopterus annectens]|uniref:protocadherin-8 n=1 Tax=Protopterus annectens TaxID=7888 RepID=UPI001CFC1580|nr:protocadherin-8 [Protopterus annectens]
MAVEGILAVSFSARCCLLILIVCTSCMAMPKTVRYQTYEEEAKGTVIGTLAEDLHLSTPEGTSFRLMKQFNTSLISVREKDGQLIIGDRIDREQLCKKSSHCSIAFDVVSLSNEQFKLIHVEVEVRDINDNSPTFPNPEISIQVSESTVVGTRIPIDIAVDDDVGSNSVQSFQISVNGHFSIEVQTRADGVKYADLVLIRGLDREAQTSHMLQLVAKDGGNPPLSGTTNIYIQVSDSNDNSPVFGQSSYKVEVNEDAPAGYLLIDLDAIDSDEGLNGEIVYGFGSQVPTEIREVFQIDQQSGRLTLRGQLDYETKQNYELDIQAQDLGLNPVPSTCKVMVHVIDVNDNAPEITITPITSIGAGVAYITEAAAKESFVALISTSDRDSGVNGRVQCRLYGHDHLGLQQAYEDSYMVLTTAPLDRERIPEYNLTVVAEDLGSPPFKTIAQFTIRVGDENDNAPLFSKSLYEVSILENNVPGAYITTVVARDPDLGHNGKVIYKLIESEVLGSSVSTYVSVDPATGAVYALRSFNYEVMKQIEMRIQACDGGSPQLSSITVIRLKTVDQNDNAPFIIHPLPKNGSVDVLVPSYATSGYQVTHIKARDVDEGINSELSYRIVQDEEHGLFAINALTGDISLTRDLSGVLADGLKLTVVVTDSGRPPLSVSCTVNFIITATAPPNDEAVIHTLKDEEDRFLQWDITLILIVVLAGSCTLLLVAIIAIAATRNRLRKESKTKKERGSPHLDISPSVLARQEEDTVMSSHTGLVFDVPFPTKVSFSSAESATEIEEPSSQAEDGNESCCLYESQRRPRAACSEGYCTTPGLGKDPPRHDTLWKGHSFGAIPSRDLEKYSGKDSGKGDSDFNDSDSELGGDAIKKDVIITRAQNGLWACTSECKVLGHSDRCWSPSFSKAPSQSSVSQSSHLSTFSKTASLPRDHLRREHYYQAHIPKTTGLQSVYEKVLHREYDRQMALVSPPRLVRLQELHELDASRYKTNTDRYMQPQVVISSEEM